MRYGSVCSGIEAASAAWMPLGFEPAWFSEINPFASAVLAERFPGVPNLGDMRTIGEQHGPIDILVGGTQCQSFSINGKRRGLAEDRGELTLHYAKLLEVLRPRWFVWENVPGIISIDGQRAFRRYLEIAVDECGYGVSWRVLDCQGFGTPQRRRRLFVVGHSGGQWRKAAAVLFDARGRKEDDRQVTPEQQGGASGVDGSSRGRTLGWTGDETPKFAVGVSPTLRSSQGGEGAGFIADGVAARFMPVEWERLMGFPDGWTDVMYKGRRASDKQRTTTLGNSFPVTIMRWIGRRIAYVEGNDRE